jgi:hypothetical protein
MMQLNATSLMLKFDRSAERTSTTLLTSSACQGGTMSAKASAAKVQERQDNVIAFPKAPRLRLAIRCEDAARAAICSHCGGVLSEGESEDDCSSVRVFRSS